MKRQLGVVLTALLIVTAGCTSGQLGGGTTLDAAGDTPSDTGDAATPGDSVAGPAGSVNFYVSDRPGAMDDFQHLNVTITTVKFHLVDPANESADENDTDTGENATSTAANTTTETTTATDATVTATATVTNTTAEETATDDEPESEDGRWVVRDVNATTVDLTELRGVNATLVDAFDLPAGEYNTVRMEISDVNGTLTNGDSQYVKLPSGKLQLNSQFTIENGSEVDFVYDVTVHEAGNSGKYILKPVVSESGTDQEIEAVGPDGEPVERDDDSEDDEENSLSATLQGTVTPGETVTLNVTGDNGPVANATVVVDGEEVGATDSSGTYDISIADDAETLEIEIEHDDSEAELEYEFESEGE